MKIKRTLNTIDAKYDLEGLSRTQFSFIHRCVHLETMRCRNGSPIDSNVPEGGMEELLLKITQMADSDTLII